MVTSEGSETGEPGGCRGAPGVPPVGGGGRGAPRGLPGWASRGAVLVSGPLLGLFALLIALPSGWNLLLLVLSLAWLAAAWVAVDASWRGAMVLAFLAWWAVVLTRADPGITSDELFNAGLGKSLVCDFLERGWGFFSDESIRKTFGHPPDAHQHPPLGRWMIGWVHWLQDPRPRDRNSFSFTAARVAPACVFALTVFLVARSLSRRHGFAAGAVAGGALLLMPRSFAHAHFAALDTFMSCAYLMGVLSAAWMMQGPRTWLRAPLAGLLLAVALLTKLHGVFLVPLVGFWLLAFYRLRGVVPLLIWGGTGLAGFFAGWPWLWDDLRAFGRLVRAGGLFRPTIVADLPYAFSRLTTFLGTSVDRESISVWYFGDSYPDTDVPWHFPWLLFAVTVPIGLHLLALGGLGRGMRRGSERARDVLLIAAVLLPLVVFSLPRVPVYDGTRMFLMVFPVWAMWAGRGGGGLFDWLSPRYGVRAAATAVTALVLLQGYGLLHYHPFQLSYYNAALSDVVLRPLATIRGRTGNEHVAWAVSGLRGAERLGLEVTYWGDTVGPELIRRWSDAAGDGACAVIAPTLYAGHELVYETEIMARRGQHFAASPASHCGYLIVYNRRAYLGHELLEVIEQRTPIAAESRDGVWLSGAYAVPAAGLDRGAAALPY